MVLDPIPQSLPVDFFWSRPQPPTSHVYHGRSRECSRLSFRHSQCSIANVYQGHGIVNQGTSRECPPKTIIGLFCRISSLLSGSFAKETYNFARMSTKDIRMYTTAALENIYGVATISRLLQIRGLFCRISSLLYGSFAKETYNFKEPMNRSHPIPRQTVSMHCACLPLENVYQGHSNVPRDSLREGLRGGYDE